MSICAFECQYVRLTQTCWVRVKFLAFLTATASYVAPGNSGSSVGGRQGQGQLHSPVMFRVKPSWLKLDTWDHKVMNHPQFEKNGCYSKTSDCWCRGVFLERFLRPEVPKDVEQ